jgi:hypothetical protein
MNNMKKEIATIIDMRLKGETYNDEKYTSTEQMKMIDEFVKSYSNIAWGIPYPLKAK